MPVIPEDRPLDVLRDDTVDQLIMNYGHGHLSLEAFQRRLDQAFDATSHEQLTALTGDLQLHVDRGYVDKKREELGFHYEDPDDADDVDYLICIFGGSDRGGEWTAAREIRVFTLFGGSDIDFSNAHFSSRTIRIRLVCVFGGVDIYVPEGVSTTVKTFNIFGGVSNKAPSVREPNAPRIIVEGLVLFGGVDVKVRRTLKERMLEFADGLRSMFGQSP